MNNKTTEHFCTIFDSNFLTIGVTLARTLAQHCSDATLWVICLDERVYEQLTQLNLPDVRPVALSDVETTKLLAIKSKRSRAEYAWTLTPFACDTVFRLAPEVSRATYIDADLGFFDSPMLLIDEMVEAGKDVLITEHAFAPEYAHGIKHGRFCVQFMTFNRSDAGMKVMRQWQNQVLDWCYARLENGRFGDQMYLDVWPQEHGQVVHILKQTQRTLAPWNVSHVAESRGTLEPVFFHFHGLRFVTPKRLRLYSGYRINAAARGLYDQYLESLRQSIELLKAANLPIQSIPLQKDLKARLEQWLQKCRGLDAFVKFKD